MLLSYLQNMAQLILFSMMIFRYEVALMVNLLLKDFYTARSSFYCLFFLFFQGTAAVVLAGVVAALKLIGGTLAEHTFLFLGAGEVRLLFSSLLHTGFSFPSVELRRTKT
jgi:hypothetical protein